MAQDALDLGLESHVEHAIRFIEDEDTHFPQSDGALLKMVIEASGSGDEHTRILAQHLALQVH
ncbi:hypothetical protein A2635_00045 [Candidatus Peribacteria bacterium RIFCSPHIGHO2_01_FULL_51_9]|nr:MAG: hypothetical protein A2635_00045 [Candidatus Peribacteria bacterium RIFCSPHIGHO2_01_FULL_51_9]